MQVQLYKTDSGLRPLVNLEEKKGPYQMTGDAYWAILGLSRGVVVKSQAPSPPLHPSPPSTPFTPMPLPLQTSLAPGTPAA